MRNSEKRESILKTANDLFERSGFNGIGVDLIAKESKVTKRTLYKHFGSKEGLIKEVLLKHHSEMMESTRARILAVEGGAKARLLACIEDYRTWFGKSNFNGCIFIKTLNEFAGCSTALGQIAQDAKDGMRAFIAEIATEYGAKGPEKLALELQLLLEGSIILAQSGSGLAAIEASLEVAEDLIDRALT